MTDRTAQRTTQLRNIEAATGKTIADFDEELGRAGIDKHGQMVAYLKTDFSMTHGNANLVAHLVREARAGGPASEEALLEGQYADGKSHLRPILDEVSRVADGLGDDVERVVLKTGVSFRRRKQFALVEAPSSKRVQLGLNLDQEPEDPRISEAKGMCSHRMDLTDVSQVDESVSTVLAQAYRLAE